MTFLVLKLPRNAIHAFGSTCDGRDLADWAMHARGQICFIDGIKSMLARKTIFALLFSSFVLKLPRNAINAFGCSVQGHAFTGWTIDTGG
jgi:hypothetical protein